MLNVIPHDRHGNPLGGYGNPIDVHLMDLHHNMFYDHIKNQVGTVSTLNLPAVKNEYQIQTVDAFTQNDKIIVRQNGIQERDVLKVVAIDGSNNITLDRRLDNNFSIGAIVERVEIDLTVNGSIGSPVSYKHAPPSDEVHHLEYIIVAIESTGQPDLTLFGGISALTNGLCFRRVTNISNYQTHFVIRKNLAFLLKGFHIDFSIKAGGANYITYAIIDLKNVSSGVHELNGANGDYYEVLVQDDLTDVDMPSLEIGMIGHILTQEDIEP